MQNLNTDPAADVAAALEARAVTDADTRDRLEQLAANLTDQAERLRLPAYVLEADGARLSAYVGWRRDDQHTRHPAGVPRLYVAVTVRGLPLPRTDQVGDAYGEYLPTADAAAWSTAPCRVEGTREGRRHAGDSWAGRELTRPMRAAVLAARDGHYAAARAYWGVDDADLDTLVHMRTDMDAAATTARQLADQLAGVHRQTGPAVVALEPGVWRTCDVCGRLEPAGGVDWPHGECRACEDQRLEAGVCIHGVFVGGMGRDIPCGPCEAG